jgi:hypothetical protein
VGETPLALSPVRPSALDDALASFQEMALESVGTPVSGLETANLRSAVHWCTFRLSDDQLSDRRHLAQVSLHS